MTNSVFWTTAVLLLAACGAKSDADSNEAVEAPAPDANAAIPATPAAAPADGGFSAAYMVGKWSAMGEDCSSTLDFKSDGTVTTPIGEAKYNVNGDQLSFDYGDGSKPTVSTVKAIDPNRIEIAHDSGTKETEKRC